MAVPTAVGEHGYLRSSQVARLLGVHPETVRRMIHSRKLRATRTPGGHYRVLEGDAISALARLSA